MPRQKLYSHQYEQYDEKPQRHGLLWLIFFMPGSVLMWIQYMFPERGHVYASGRRYGNRVIQFFYTLIIYGLLIGAYFVFEVLRR
jgi:hypothetical protein